jgi:hypothetical protein
MEKIFKFNGKSYRAVPFNFNTICDLEGYGVSLGDISEKPVSTVRAYFALCGHMSVDEAGAELEAGIVNGETMNAIMDVMQEQIADSGFFHAINKSQEETPQESEDEEAPEQTVVAQVPRKTRKAKA